MTLSPLRLPVAGSFRPDTPMMATRSGSNSLLLKQRVYFRKHAVKAFLGFCIDLGPHVRDMFCEPSCRPNMTECPGLQGIAFQKFLDCPDIAGLFVPVPAKSVVQKGS